MLEESPVRGSFPGQGVTADPNDDQALIRWRGKSMGKEQQEGEDLGKHRVRSSEVWDDAREAGQAAIDGTCGSWGNGKPLECRSQGRGRFRLAEVMQNELKRNQRG